jgi:hypothetical protein
LTSGAGATFTSTTFVLPFLLLVVAIEASAGVVTTVSVSAVGSSVVGLGADDLISHLSPCGIFEVKNLEKYNFLLIFNLTFVAFSRSLNPSPK